MKLDALTTSSVLQGGASPLPDPNDFTLTLNCKVETAGTLSSLGAVALMTTDTVFDPHNPHADNDGYNLLVRQSGTLQIYRLDNGASTLLQEVAGSAIAIGNSSTQTITVTPTSITFTRADTSQSVTVNDATYRGAFPHFLNVETNGGHGFSFGDVVVS